MINWHEVLTPLRTGINQMLVTWFQDLGMVISLFLTLRWLILGVYSAFSPEPRLEQGFTLHAPPALTARGWLALDLTFSGTLTATLADTQIVNGRPSGTAIDFTAPDGARVLRYGGLRVTDATGRELDARLVPLSGGEVVELSIPQTSPALTGADYETDPAILTEL